MVQKLWHKTQMRQKRVSRSFTEQSVFVSNGQIQSSKFEEKNWKFQIIFLFWLAYLICWFWLYSIIFNISGMNPIVERIPPITERVFIVCHSNSWAQKSKMYKFFNKLILLCLESSSAPPPLCVEMGFTWTFSRNQDATVKLKSELIAVRV